MNTIHSKSAFVYGQVKSSLRCGNYIPGQRIDPGTLASQFNTSPTPVRFALYRLVGEGLVADHARDGLHVPMPNELILRDLYDGMQRLLMEACDIGESSTTRTRITLEIPSTGDDLVRRTCQLFNAIACMTGHRSLQPIIINLNDRLAPTRRAKQGLIEQTHEELSRLIQHWQAQDMPALKRALRDYHQRRKQRVAEIVERLSERLENH